MKAWVQFSSQLHAFSLLLPHKTYINLIGSGLASEGGEEKRNHTSDGKAENSQDICKWGSVHSVLTPGLGLGVIGSHRVSAVDPLIQEAAGPLTLPEHSGQFCLVSLWHPHSHTWVITWHRWNSHYSAIGVLAVALLLNSACEFNCGTLVLVLSLKLLFRLLRREGEGTSLLALQTESECGTPKSGHLVEILSMWDWHS